MSTITVITSNAAGGARQVERRPDILAQALAAEGPDLVFLQELVVCKSGEQIAECSTTELVQGGLRTYQPVFVPTVNSRDYPCPRIVPGTNRPGKWYTDRFGPYTYAAQGNGFLISEQWRIEGVQEYLVSDFDQFKGDRETEPRKLVIVEVGRDSDRLLLACIHLTTLREEDTDTAKAQIGSVIRLSQAQKIVDRLSDSGQTVILAGDFNAESGSAEISLFEQRGYYWLNQRCSAKDLTLGTHVRRSITIDHIFVKGNGRSVNSPECRVLAGLENATDHRPVLTRFLLA